MEKFASLPPLQRAEIFGETAFRKGFSLKEKLLYQRCSNSLRDFPRTLILFSTGEKSPTKIRLQNARARNRNHLTKKSNAMRNRIVRAIQAERTFWEKVTILHHEAHRPPENPQPSRYSRHYYDLARMAASPVKVSAFANLELLKSVVASKEQFYPRSWARYDLAKPGSMKLLPPSYLLQSLRRDYQEVKIMIYGQSESFDEILYRMRLLESEMNSL
jgi:hypothetical protein